jgi:hypothetical protein
MHISVSGIIHSDEPLTDERHEQIIIELVDWAEERGLYLTLVTKLEEAGPGDSMMVGHCLDKMVN